MRFRADGCWRYVDISKTRAGTRSRDRRKLGVKQPRVSELMNGKIPAFSSDLLVGFLATARFRLAPAFTPATKTRRHQ